MSIIEKKKKQIELVQELHLILNLCEGNEIKELLSELIFENYDIKTVSLVLDKVDDVNYGDTWEKNDGLLNINPLITACTKKRLDIVKLLVERKNANVNILSCDKKTPIMFSMQESDYDTVEYLYKNGALLEVGSVNIGQFVKLYDGKLFTNFLEKLLKSSINRMNVILGPHNL